MNYIKGNEKSKKQNPCMKDDGWDWYQEGRCEKCVYFHNGEPKGWFDIEYPDNVDRNLWQKESYIIGCLNEDKPETRYDSFILKKRKIK